MATVFTLGIGIIGFLILAVLGPLAFAGGYRFWRSRYPSVKASFVLYTVAVEAVALVLLAVMTLHAFSFAGSGPSPLSPDVTRWIVVATIAVIVLGVSALVGGAVLDPRLRRGSDETGP